MAINMFEGARRISKIVAAIWVIGWSLGTFSDGYDIYDKCIRAIPVKTVIEEKNQFSIIDLTKLSDEDLIALEKGDYKSMSDEGLALVAAEEKARIEKTKQIPTMKQLIDFLKEAEKRGDREGLRGALALAKRMAADPSFGDSGNRVDNKLAGGQGIKPVPPEDSLFGDVGVEDEITFDYRPGENDEPVVERDSICENRSIDSKGWTQLLKDLGDKVLWVISGLLFLWAFTWAIGWIVRGFMGIPRGQDKK